MATSEEAKKAEEAQAKADAAKAEQDRKDAEELAKLQAEEDEQRIAEAKKAAKREASAKKAEEATASKDKTVHADDVAAMVAAAQTAVYEPSNSEVDENGEIDGINPNGEAPQPAQVTTKGRQYSDDPANHGDFVPQAFSQDEVEEMEEELHKLSRAKMIYVAQSEGLKNPDEIGETNDDLVQAIIDNRVGNGRPHAGTVAASSDLPTGDDGTRSIPQAKKSDGDKSPINED